MLMKFFGRMRCVTVKNWLDFGGDPAHVTLGLRITSVLAAVCAVSCDLLYILLITRGIHW